MWWEMLFPIISWNSEWRSQREMIFQLNHLIKQLENFQIDTPRLNSITEKINLSLFEIFWLKHLMFGNQIILFQLPIWPGLADLLVPMASPRVPDSHSLQLERHEGNNFDNIQRGLSSLHPSPGQNCLDIMMKYFKKYQEISNILVAVLYKISFVF